MNSIDLIIKGYEIEMWEAALARDQKKFLEVVAKDAVMVCGGYRCSGEEYSEIIKEFNLSTYELKVYETVLITENVVQNHYVVTTKVEEGENPEFAGTFHVTSTWKKENDTWKMIYNMDSTIVED